MKYRPNEFNLNTNTKIIDIECSNHLVSTIIIPNIKTGGVIIRFITYKDNKIKFLSKRQIKKIIVPILKERNNEFPGLTNWQCLIHKFNELCGTSNLEFKLPLTYEVFSAVYKGKFISLHCALPV